MKLLLNGRWTDDCLDYWKAPSDCRIRVLALENLGRVDGLYFVRRGSIRMLINYIRDIGVVATIRKVWSRKQEAGRNEKFTSWGVGEVVEPAENGKFRVGDRVLFIAPAHPACVERLTVPEVLLAAAPEAALAALKMDTLLYNATSKTNARWWHSLRGWNPYAGVSVDSLSTSIESGLVEIASMADWSGAVRVDTSSTARIRTRSRANNATKSKRTAALFGYGNYAKSIILPNIRGKLNVVAIHEIDPTQVPLLRGANTTWDTAPVLAPDEQYTAVFVAGYHHTHADLAVQAIERQMYAVVEKPVVVDAGQLDAIIAANRGRSRLFACFHKRYMVFNSMALGDLGVRLGERVDYHCVVYEVPLPPLHWYRWPNSRSRLVSNGCHWIDHFLFLNGYADVSWHDVAVGDDGTINCSIQLVNGAFFTMVLTDQGSERVGVQDYIELRANGVTVRMINGSRYVAEGSDRVIRTRRINKLDSYRNMYRIIAEKIAAGEDGDSCRSLEVSSRTILELEDQFRMACRGRELEGGLVST